MSNTVNNYLKATRKYDETFSFQKVRPRLQCKDGASVSIQAGEYLYSTPRLDEVNYYSHVECGYPEGMIPESWREYAEDRLGNNKIHDFRLSLKEFLSSLSYYLKCKFGISDFPATTTILRMRWKSLFRPRHETTIYPYIPTELVEEFINSHGGCG